MSGELIIAMQMNNVEDFERVLSGCKAIINATLKMHLRDGFGRWVLVDFGRTALTAAAASGQVQFVDKVLNVRGIDVNATGNFGLSPLMVAAYHNHAPVVTRLLRVPGINVNARNDKGDTALAIAAKRDYCDVLEVLLTHPGLDMATRRETTETARVLRRHRRRAWMLLCCDAK